MARDTAGAPLGCVVLWPTAMPRTGEIKRLYLLPVARGKALERRLA